MSHPLKHASGFTLVELVLTLVIVGVLAANAIPRFFNRQTYEARGFHDQMLAMLRYGQKLAVAQRTNVFFNTVASNGKVCISYAADASCAGSNLVRNPADGNGFLKTAPTGVTISAVAFSFSGLGSPLPDASFAITVTGDGVTRTSTVERGTGYVH